MCEQSYSVESVLQKMQTSLACTICLDLLINPLTTKCGHTFCKECLDRLHLGSKNSFPCPLCMAQITRRSVSQNAKITALVFAVRKVISSIKEDCGFQEPNKSISRTSEVEPEKKELEEEVPIRRTTRKNKPISYFADEVYHATVNKRKSNKKLKNEEEDTNEKLIPNAVKEIDNTSGKELSNIITAGPSGATDFPLQSISSKPPLSKVEQWLSKNESINFGKEEKPSPDEDLLPTQVFQEKLTDVESDSVCNREDQLSKVPNGIDKMWTSQASTIIFNTNKILPQDMKSKVTNNVDNMWTSQASTIIFNTDKILPQEMESKSVQENVHDNKIAEEELAKEETNSMMSEKENEKNTALISQLNEKRRGSKRILFEPNNIDVKKINKRNVKHKLINDGRNTENKEIVIPKQFLDLSISNINKDEVCKSLDAFDAPSKFNVKEKSKCEGDSSVNEHEQHPNSKGHNIRFASGIKLKLIDSVKPTKLSTKGKTKKSPGWSRIEGARRDLRSKHISLNISGGEQKVNSDSSKLELSKLAVDSSQESVVVIEELNSQINDKSNSVAKGQKKYPNIHIKSSHLPPQTNSFKNKPSITYKFLNKRAKTLDVKSESVKKDDGNDGRNVESELKNKTIHNLSLQLDSFDKVEILGKCEDQTIANKLDKSNVAVPEIHEENVTKTTRIVDSIEKINKEDSILQNTSTTFKSRLSRKNTVNNIVDNSNVAVSNEIQIPDEKEAEDKIMDCDNAEGSSEKDENEQISLNELKLPIKKNVSDDLQEIIQDADKQVAKNDGKRKDCKSVPFHIEGTVEENRNFPSSSCSHSVPCELFHMLVKYSQFLVTESQKSPCLNFSQNSKLPIQKADTNSSLKVTKNPSASTITESSVVPDSCIDDYVQEVAIILPDSVPGTSLKFNENLTRNISLKELEKSTKIGENFNSKDDDKSADISVFEDAVESQSSQLSASLLHSNKSALHNKADDKPAMDDLDVHSNEEPNHKIGEAKLNMEMTQNSKKLSTSLRNSPKSYFDSQDFDIREPVSLISETSDKQHFKNTSESPINTFKRGKRTQRIDSSSSSSEDELPDIINPQKKAKVQSPVSPPLQDNPKIDSEEMRDFERYDENIWNYYNNKLNIKEKEEIKIEPKALNKTVNNIDESDDDLIPGTEEVLKNIDADVAGMKEKSEPKNLKEENSMDCESVDGTVDLFSQESVVTTSTTCGMNSSIKELFNKCSKSLNLAHKALYGSQALSQDFEKPNSILNTSVKPSSDCRDESVAIHGKEDTENSYFSAFSTDSPVLSTQQKNKVQTEVETLRNKILALEAEMNKKKATLNESIMDSKKDENKHMKDSTQILTEVDLKVDKDEDFERESDLESEELFKSVPTESMYQKGVTLRNGRSLCKSMKTVKKKPITIICTGLSPVEVSKVHSFSSTLCGSDAKVMSKWSEEITHVIVNTDNEGMTERTLKYLLGVASGAWVVSIGWVTDSLTSRIFLPEDEYEALDCTGAPGPSRGRRVSIPIFSGFQFCLVPPFEEVSMDQLQELIKICRGSVVKRFNEEISGPKLFIVNSEDPEKDTSEPSHSKKRDKVTVGHDWIIECIGMYSLVSLLNYMIGIPTPVEIKASGIPASLIHETQDII